MPPRESPLPTIEDVARRAGVSTATVSRVLNQTDAVRESLRHKVESAVAALGYVPHAGARTMKLRRSGTLDRKSTRLNSSHERLSRMPSAA